MAGAAIVLDEVSPLLQRVRTAAAAAGLALVGARAAGQLVREHLFGLDAQRHKGGRHYYAQAARSVTTSRVPQGAVVSITQTGFRQRLKGGTIKAGQNGSGRKFLTIPEDDEAIGKRAGEFKDLRLERNVINPRTGALMWALVRNMSTPITMRRRVQKDGSIKTTITPGKVIGRAGEVMYWLVRQVTQRADPTVLPHAEQMSGRAIDAIGARLLRLTDNGGNAS